ncbi:MAG TPA: hypothetical protein VEU51_13570 [Candidatus Acidoferrales bacterium]|nr:hypothetical protein [Candidatus Acidoferrales bacterium]
MSTTRWTVCVLASFMCFALLASVSVANAEQRKCEAKNPSHLKKVEGTGKGCTKEDAIQAALDGLADAKCTGEKDPKCPTADCKAGTCRPTTKKDGDNKEPCTKIALDGCAEKKGFECTVSGDFLCKCRCR